MTDLFSGFLSRAMGATWLVLAVLLFRFLFKKAPKWVDVLLWSMVALRLLLPVSLQSSLSLVPDTDTLASELVSSEVTQPAAPRADAPSGDSHIVSGTLTRPADKGSAANEVPAADTQHDRQTIAAAVWLAGVCALLTYALASFLRLRRRVATAVRVEESIYRSEAVASPFILGIVRPRIYLPCSLDGPALECVLAHERAHLARHDHWWKPLGFLLLALYWFHPLLWPAYVLFCRDVELACDERVARRLDASQRADYSQALLSCSVPRRMIVACPLAFGEVGVKERVKNVLHYQKPAVRLVALSLIACAALAVCFLTDPQRETMQWAKKLDAADVAKIELHTMPEARSTCYKLYETEEEIEEIVALINSARGRYVKSPELLSGGYIGLYLTMTDGTHHYVGNEGNVYLHIDGDSYAPSYSWLSSWELHGDSPAPEGFPDTTLHATMLAQHDLDHDGADEDIYYQETADEVYTLSVVDANGLLWSAELGLAHTGWDSYFVYQSDGVSAPPAILHYSPTVYQGSASYSYELFTLEDGRKNTLQQNSVEFDVNAWTEEAQAFADEVNALLDPDKCRVYLSTLDGELHTWNDLNYLPRCEPSREERPAVTTDGTVLTCGDYSYDLVELTSSVVTSIEDYAFVGDYLVVTGHTGPKNALYFLFEGDGSALVRCFWGTCLTWWEDDISTAVYTTAYTLGPQICAIDGSVIAELTLAEDEYVRSLDYSMDGTQLIATVTGVNDDGDGRELTYNYSAVGAAALHAVSDVFHAEGWSMKLYDGWLRTTDEPMWYKGSAYLKVTQVASLAGELTALKNAGHTVESLPDGGYLCTTQTELSTTMLYLYRIESDDAGYLVETYTDNTGDAATVERVTVQLQSMAESFTAYSTTAFDPVGEYTDSMGSSLSVRKTNGGYAVDFGIYKSIGVENAPATYDSAAKVLRFSGTDDFGHSLSASIISDTAGHLTVTLTDCVGYGDAIKTGSAFSFYPRVTGYGEYDQILAEVCDRRASGDFSDSDMDLSATLRAGNDYFQSVGWTLADIDGNGTDELILGADWDNGVTPIYNIYTRTGGTRAVSVIPQGWERSRYHLTADGLIAHEGAGGASEHGVTYYRYSESRRAYDEVLTPVETVYHTFFGGDSSASENYGYVYAAGKTMDDHENGDESFTRITDERAMEIVAKHPYESLTFTPFAV